MIAARGGASAGGDGHGHAPGTGRAGDASAGSAGEPPSARNEVLLVGRVSGAPEQRDLPSGDRLVTWRLVVERGAVRRSPQGVRAPTVDTFDCVAWTAPMRRAALALRADDLVEVRGALRRRFWRSGAGTASRCEVEATTVRRVARRAAASSP